MHDCSQPKLDQPYLQEICRCMRSCLYLQEVTSSQKNYLKSYQWKAKSLTSRMVCDHSIIWLGWATKKHSANYNIYYNWRYAIFSEWQTRNMTIVELCFLFMINFYWSYHFYFLSCPGRKWQARTEWRRTSTETRGCPSWMILHRPRFFLFIRPKSDHFLCLVTQSLSSLVELSWVATNCSLSNLLHEFF